MVLFMKIKVKIHFYYLDTESIFLFPIKLFYTFFVVVFLVFSPQLKPDAHIVGSRNVNYPFRYTVGRKRDDSYQIIILANFSSLWTHWYSLQMYGAVGTRGLSPFSALWTPKALKVAIPMQFPASTIYLIKILPIHAIKCPYNHKY